MEVALAVWPALTRGTFPYRLELSRLGGWLRAFGHKAMLM